uniref:Uncharacterized protein n=1 Tax=Avena sativa TaxID=4498 RepID=A0ACD5X227_AVESA
MPKGGGVSVSRTEEEMEAEIEERVRARMLAAKNGGRELAAPRAARDAGMSSTAFPLLTRSNYHDWSLLMRVILQGRGWWKAVETGEAEFTDDRLALEAILRAVPPEMHGTLAVKTTAKEAWDTLKTLRLGAERVRESRAQTLRLNYEEIKFRPGESIDDFAMRLQALANELEVLGDPLDEKKVVLKLLRIAPKRYKQLCWSIESLVDMNTLSIEELVGRLKVVDERDDDEHDSSSKLLLTEDQWRARMHCEHGGSSGSSGSTFVPNRRRGRGRGRGQDGARNKAGEGGQRGRSVNGAPKDNNCRYCGIPGHWARECRKKQRDEAHLVRPGDDDDEPAMLMAQVTAISIEPERIGGHVFLNEERAKVRLGDEAEPVDAPWYLDTGASNHMTGDRKAFADLDEKVTGSVKFGDNSVVSICGRGTVMFTSRGGEHRALTEVYFIPRLKTSIISLGQLDENGCETMIRDGTMHVRDRNRRLLAKVERSRNRLYKVPLQIAQPICLSARRGSDAWRWHERLGHQHFAALEKMARTSMVRGLPKIDHVDELCDACLAGKQRRAPFPQTDKFRAMEKLELVHGDLCGPISPPTPGGKRYFLLLVDDHSRYMWLTLLASKDEAEAAIKRFKASAEVQSGCKLRTMRTDRGGEFTSKDFDAYCAEHGVQRHLSAPYSPQQNGVVERRNQTVFAMARSMLKARGVPSKFWGEAVTTAVYILNRSYTRSVDGKTPYEVWHAKIPNLHYIRVFGCLAHVKTARPQLKKLDDRSTPMVLMGYDVGSKAYKLFDPVSQRAHVSRDVVFDEDASWVWGEQAEAHPANTFTVDFPVPETDTSMNNADIAGDGGAVPAPPLSPEQPEEPATPAAVPATQRAGHGAPVEFVSPPSGVTPTSEDGDGRLRRFRTIDNIVAEYAEELLLVVGEEPATFAEAEPHPAWRAAMLEEMSAIEENGTWELTSLPAGHRPIGLKWVFKLKKNTDGDIVKHKARLVAKGYVQRAGVDFDEVFAPVARLDSVRLLIAIAAQQCWEVHHMDVKSAFLNGDLQEEVYVAQPPGFVREGQEGKVLRLRKALYGLRQAPRAWNTKLDSTLLSLGFQRIPSEHAVYVRGIGDARLLLGVYVDDLIVTGASAREIAKFKIEMQGTFKMSDLGLLSYYLGIEVKQTPGEITLGQAAYAGKLLEKAGMGDCNPVHVPMEPRLKLSKESSNPPVDVTFYRSIVGSLRYLVHTRPDITFTVGYISRFMEKPTTQHMATVKHLLRYIAGTRNYGCRYVKDKDGGKLIGYSDSDMAGDIDDRKSTSGVLFMLGRNPVTWQSQKQKVVALSSCEAEYIAATTAACQGVWLGRLLGDLLGKKDDIATIFVDNKSAIQLCKNPVFHDRSKHIETRFHFIRECVDDGKINVEYIGTEDQLADILTKALGRIQFQNLRERIGIVDI